MNENKTPKENIQQFLNAFAISNSQQANHNSVFGKHDSIPNSSHKVQPDQFSFALLIYSDNRAKLWPVTAFPSSVDCYPQMDYLHQGRPKAPPATQNALRESSGGDKNKEVRGTEFTLLFQGKISALNRLNRQTIYRSITCNRHNFNSQAYIVRFDQFLYVIEILKLQ